MARRRHAHARTAPRIPFAVLGVTFPLASAFSMVGEHARLGGSRRMKSPPWLTLWTLFKRSQWLNQHLQGIVTHGRQVRARGPSRRQRLRPRGSGPGRRVAEEPLLICPPRRRRQRRFFRVFFSRLKKITHGHATYILSVSTYHVPMARPLPARAARAPAGLTVLATPERALVPAQRYASPTTSAVAASAATAAAAAA